MNGGFQPGAHLQVQRPRLCYHHGICISDDRVVVGVLASIGVKVTYDEQIRRLWNEIRDDWQAHERMLAEDPRNGQREVVLKDV